MLNKLSKEIHQNARDKGWYDDERSFGDVCSLIHSEVSEAFEEYRNGKEVGETYYKCDMNNNNCGGVCDTCTLKKPEGVPSELADVIIRVLDYCGAEEIDIDEIVRIKMKFNSTRSYKHGGKKL